MKKYGILIIILILTVFAVGCESNDEERKTLLLTDYEGKSVVFLSEEIFTYHSSKDEAEPAFDVFYIKEDSLENVAQIMEDADRARYSNRRYEVTGENIVVYDGEEKGQTFYIWKNGDKKKKMNGYFITNGTAILRSGDKSLKVLLPLSAAVGISKNQGNIEWQIEGNAPYTCTETAEELKSFYEYNGFKVEQNGNILTVTKENAIMGETVATKKIMFNVELVLGEARFTIVN